MNEARKKGTAKHATPKDLHKRDSGSGRVTIREVARRAGVSVGSVSRVLNDGPFVSEHLRTRVMAAVEKLGFAPNGTARSLRTRATRTIGCLVSGVSNPLYAEIVEAAEDELNRAGYMLLLHNSKNDAQRELGMLSLLRSGTLDGAIIAPSDERNPELVAAIRAAGERIVILDRSLPIGVDAVLVDHRGGAREAAAHLLAMGHRRIALLTPGDQVWPGRERVLGLREAHRAARVPLDESLIVRQRVSTNSPTDEVRDLLSLRDAPTAIIVLSTRMMAGTIRTIRQSGFSIPRDISVIGVGDTDLTSTMVPAISVVRWDLAELGRSAARLIIAKVNSGAAPRHLVHIPTELAMRDSCAPPRDRLN